MHAVLCTCPSNLMPSTIQAAKADLTVADRNFAMRSCRTGILRTSLTVGRRLGSVRKVMSTRSFKPLEYVDAIGR